MDSSQDPGLYASQLMQASPVGMQSSAEMLLDENSIGVVVVGATSPAYTDGKAVNELKKTIPVIFNHVLDNQNCTYIFNFLTDSEVIGYFFKEIMDGTDKVYDISPIKVSSDLTDFYQVRAVTGSITIKSNTRSTDATVLDGNITTIAVNEFPPEFSYNSLGRYCCIEKGNAINTLLSNGHTIIAYPYWHDFKQTVVPKRTTTLGTSQSIASIPVDNINTATITLPVGSAYQRINNLHLKIEIDVDSADITNLPNPVCDISVVFAKFNNETYVDMQEPFRVTGVPFASDFPIDVPHNMTLAQIIISSPGIEFPGEVFLYSDDPIMQPSPYVKYITSIQGSTGVKNITGSGVMCYELLPFAKNYTQVTLVPGASFSPYQLDIFKGLLNNPNSLFRLVYQGEDYKYFIKTFLTDYGKESLLEQALEAQSYHASVFSTLGNLVKRGVGWLKSRGINPAAGLRKLVDVAEANGYASTPSTFVAPNNLQVDASTYYASTNINDTFPMVIPDDPDTMYQGPDTYNQFLEATLEVVRKTPIELTFHAEDDNSNIPRIPDPDDEGTYYASSPWHYSPTNSGTSAPPAPPPTPPQSMQDAVEADATYEMTFQDDDVEEAVEAASKVTNTAQLVREDILKSLPYQIRYNANTFATYPALMKIRRYSMFIIVDGKGSQGIPATMEWSTIPRDNFRYTSISQILSKAGLASPSWLSYVYLDDKIAQVMLKGTPELSALYVIFNNPKFAALATSRKNRTAIYISIITADTVKKIEGTSWFGAFYALLFAKDPTVVYEIGAYAYVVGAQPFCNVMTVSHATLKYRTIQDINHGKLNPAFGAAIKDLNLSLTPAFMIGRETQKMINEVGVTKGFIETLFLRAPKLCKVLLLDSFWMQLSSYMTKGFSVFYSKMAERSSLPRLEVNQHTKEVEVTFDKKAKNVNYAPPPTADEWDNILRDAAASGDLMAPNIINMKAAFPAKFEEYVATLGNRRSWGVESIYGFISFALPKLAKKKKKEAQEKEFYDPVKQETFKAVVGSTKGPAKPVVNLMKPSQAVMQQNFGGSNLFGST